MHLDTNTLSLENWMFAMLSNNSNNPGAISANFSTKQISYD